MSLGFPRLFEHPTCFPNATQDIEVRHLQARQRLEEWLLATRSLDQPINPVRLAAADSALKWQWICYDKIFFEPVITKKKLEYELMILNKYVTLSWFLELIINGLWTKYQLIKIIDVNLGMGQNLLVSILMGWTSIYQLFCGSPGTRVMTHSHLLAPCTSPCFFRNSKNAEVMARFSGSQLLVMAGTAEPNDGCVFVL